MSAVDAWLQLQNRAAQADAHMETFEHEQQTQVLTQLLASPSTLYVHAAAFGQSPAAFRLKCWKVRSIQSCCLETHRLARMFDLADLYWQVIPTGTCYGARHRLSSCPSSKGREATMLQYC